MIQFDSIRPHICIPLESDELPIVKGADKGDAEAQNDLALIFLFNRKPKSALYWLELAAKQGYADAMHWLARCCLEGNGAPKNENFGLMWLANAAAHGHIISQGQIQAMSAKFTGGVEEATHAKS